MNFKPFKVGDRIKRLPSQCDGSFKLYKLYTVSKVKGIFFAGNGNHFLEVVELPDQIHWERQYFILAGPESHLPDFL